MPFSVCIVLEWNVCCCDPRSIISIVVNDTVNLKANRLLATGDAAVNREAETLVPSQVCFVLVINSRQWTDYISNSRLQLSIG